MTDYPPLPWKTSFQLDFKINRKGDIVVDFNLPGFGARVSS
jgi:hypothetical protein